MDCAKDKDREEWEKMITVDMSKTEVLSTLNDAMTRRMYYVDQCLDEACIAEQQGDVAYATFRMKMALHAEFMALWFKDWIKEESVDVLSFDDTALDYNIEDIEF